MTPGSGERENFFSLEGNEFRHRGAERADREASGITQPRISRSGLILGGAWRSLSRRFGGKVRRAGYAKSSSSLAQNLRFCDSLERQVLQGIQVIIINASHIKEL